MKDILAAVRCALFSRRRRRHHPPQRSSGGKKLESVTSRGSQPGKVAPSRLNMPSSVSQLYCLACSLTFAAAAAAGRLISPPTAAATIRPISMIIIFTLAIAKSVLIRSGRWEAANEDDDDDDV